MPTQDFLEQFTAEFTGMPLPEQVVVVERGPVATFATAITDPNPVFRAPDGPTPPTWPFVMQHFGAFPELQPDMDGAPSPVTTAIGRLLSTGGLLLHGEQEFTYERPVRVGDHLRGTGQIEQVDVKQSGERTMTFLVVRTDWSEAASGAPVCTSRMTLIHRA